MDLRKNNSGLAGVLMMCWIGLALPAPAKVATWTGDSWDTMTRARMVEIADEMIDTTWTPAETIRNYRSPTQPRTTFTKGVTYRGVAYNMIYEADNLPGFLGKVNSTPGGDTSYGNDCSGFISIAWRLPRRLNTVRFEDEVTGPAILAHSLGPIGSGATVDLVQGDVFNRSGSHNIMFDRYSATGVVSMEQTPGPRVTTLPHPEMRRNWTWSSLGNYRPIRRNLIFESEPSPIFLEGEWAGTTASSLNFRSGPGTEHSVIATLPRGTIVRIEFHPENGIRVGNNNWWFVEPYGDGRKGWLAESFLEASYAPAGGEWADVVMDTNHEDFEASANWVPGQTAADQYGTNYRYRSTGAVSDPAAWTAELPYGGSYRVYAWWSETGNSATAAPYWIRHVGNETLVMIDQRTNGGRWNDLGTFDFADGQARVRLSCWTASGDIIIADAVRFLALDPRPQVFHTYSKWELDEFTDEERQQAGFSDPQSDPFSRGIPNLLVYAFGLEPRFAQRSDLPQVERDHETLTFVFRRLREEADIGYVLETSTDLVLWSRWEPEEDQVEVLNDPASLTETVRVRLPVDDSAASRFVRLRIEQNDR